jgi:hypothetical protein
MDALVHEGAAPVQGPGAPPTSAVVVPLAPVPRDAWRTRLSSGPRSSPPGQAGARPQKDASAARPTAGRSRTRPPGRLENLPGPPTPPGARYRGRGCYNKDAYRFRSKVPQAPPRDCWRGRAAFLALAVLCPSSPALLGRTYRVERPECSMAATASMARRYPSPPNPAMTPVATGPMTET